MPTRAAVFLDRDGTIIVDRHYLGDPAGVELLPRGGEAVARLNAAGHPTFLVTNQSGIGRGYFTEEQYAAVHARLEELLGQHGGRLDGAWFVGDRLRDVIPAATVGGHAVLVLSPESEREEALALPFIRVVPSLWDAVEVILAADVGGEQND